MKLTQQTVYIPTQNKSDFQVSDPSQSSNAYVKTGYFLSEDEFKQLLHDAMEEAVNIYIGFYDDVKNGFDNEQFINNLFNPSTP